MRRWGLVLVCLAVGVLALFLTKREPAAPPTEQTVPVVAVSPPLETPTPEPTPAAQVAAPKRVPSATELAAAPERSLDTAFAAWSADRADDRAKWDVLNHLKEMDLDAAEPWFRKALALRPIDPDFAEAFGMRLVDAKRFQDVIDTYKRILSAEPGAKNHAAEILRNAYMKLEDDAHAVDYARKALEIEPTPANYLWAADCENGVDRPIAAVSTAKRGQAEIARRRAEAAAAGKQPDPFVEDYLTENEIWLAVTEIEAEITQGHGGDARRLIDAAKSRIAVVREQGRMTKILDQVEAAVFKLEDRL